ncbi:hypothetical protein [Cognatilysobacter bugurensis]|uniref:Uncharacterized protein n=1 Tax=Cognatilysobacter bugurensis TaxID=543356 RepID=A0A918T1S5_9GAMM|nr:hypothetical protein [Lysobacter bugurensis]GHA78761.1 hypothetical protein GCM10007067_15190 [Lysobacter bugurensis]
MARDLATHDAHAQRQARLAQLMEKVSDTDIALGSDAMAIALQGYRQFKTTGQTEGVDGLRRDLSRRFEGTGRRKAHAVPDEA